MAPPTNEYYRETYQWILLAFLGPLLLPRVCMLISTWVGRLHEAKSIKSENCTEQGGRASGQVHRRNIFVRAYDGCTALLAPFPRPLSPITSNSGTKVGFFLGILLLNLVFTFVHTPSSSPESAKDSTLSKISKRTGTMAFANFPILFLLATRNNVLSYISGLPYQHFRALHKWVASIVVIFVWIHSFAYTAKNAQAGRYAQSFQKDYWNWGVVGTVVMSVLIVLPAIPFIRNRAYEFFYVAHIVGAVLFLVGSYYHMKELASWIWAAVAIWAFDRAVRLVRLVYVHFVAPVFAEKPASLGSIKVDAKVVSRAVILDLHYPTDWDAASHVYISFFGKELLRNPFLLGQNHPFSVASLPAVEESQHTNSDGNDDENEKNSIGKQNSILHQPEGTMRLICRNRGGLTRWLSREIERQGGYAEFNVFVEGPYGRLGGEWKGYDTISLLAAGSGVSHVCGILAHICKRVSQGRAGIVKNVEFTWIFKSEEELSWISPTLCQILDLAFPQDFNLRIRLRVSQSGGSGWNSQVTTINEDANTINQDTNYNDRVLNSPLVEYISGKPSLEQDFGRLAHESKDRVQVHVCGPTSFDQDVRHAAAKVSNIKEAFGGRGVIHVVTEAYE